MITSTLPRWLLPITLVLFVVFAGSANGRALPDPGSRTGGAPLLAALSAQDAIAQITGEDGTLRFDVAEDATRFVWSGGPALVDGLPADSTPCVTQGYLYPEGTLTNGNGVLPDGSPEVPEKVPGSWSCYGWHLAGGAPDRSAPWLTTHLFNFCGSWGEATIITEGYSIDDLGVSLDRAIVGGTGPYSTARGMQQETNLGFNATEGMNFRYQIMIEQS